MMALNSATYLVVSSESSSAELMVCVMANSLDYLMAVGKEP